ncbi:amtB, partial [Symbiodinium sp. KB8]
AWLDFEERALQRCGAWRGPEVVQVLHACAVAQRRPKRLLAKLSKDIPDKMPQFDVSALCICLHTFAQLRSRDASLFSVVTRRLLQPDHREELGPSHLSSLLYSHARILAFDKGLVRLAQKSLADDRRAFELEDLATVLQAFATLRAEDVRLSGNSARRVAKATPAAPLPLLADLLEERKRQMDGSG